MLVIAGCLKVIYLCDGEHGLNVLLEEELSDMKFKFQDVAEYTQFIPLILCIFLENKIARHYDFGVYHKLLAHGLTAALICYYLIMSRNVLSIKDGVVLTSEEQA